MASKFRLRTISRSKIFGSATVELVTALPELVSNVTKVAAPDVAKEVGESSIGQAYSKVLDTINPELSKEEDVAKTIATLGLSENSWLTGNTIRIDGGEDITG